MGKKIMNKLPLSSPSSSPWPWNLTCTNPKTLSFRATNSDEATIVLKAETPEAIVGDDDNECGDEESIETVIRGLKSSDSSERLFFEPGETSSILEEAKGEGPGLFKESVMVAMDSKEPFADFRTSMEEMVEAHGLRDWECLEELLSCYLRVNGRSNHGYIVGAFIDLLVGISFASSSSSSSLLSSSSSHHDNDDDHHCCCCHCSSSAANSFTSPLSFTSYYSTSSTSPCFSSLETHDEDDEIEKSIEENHASSSTSLSNHLSSSSNI